MTTQKPNINNTQNVKLTKIAKQQNDQFLALAKKPQGTLLKELKTTKNGLKPRQIEKLREVHGYNTFTTKQKSHWYDAIVDAFFNPFSIVLSVIAILNIITPIISGNSIEASDWISFGIIVSMIIVAGTIKIFQETKSSKASEKLKEMIKTTTAVTRNGITKELLIEEVLPGDIIKLAAGDMIPADMRILSAKDLFVTQSALTGESEPVEKFATAANSGINSVLECNNLCFMGTSVSSGSAIGVVINTGKNTIFGKIAKLLNAKKTRSSFDKGIRAVSWILIWTMLVLTLAVFIIVGATNKNISNNDNTNVWLKALTYALAIAVGLTPEMLPMIVTLNLAKEAVKLSKQKTIVKTINSIQSFGAMDVLCTDKTGTLTEDKIILERHINLEGLDDHRVLTYAFLNSYYQTGLKNLIDLAVIEKADKLGIDDPIINFNKIDEIPFDFKRRRMSVIIQDNSGAKQLITKGAFEEIINVCNYGEYNGKRIKLTDELRKKSSKIVNDLNTQGMRVIAVAVNHTPLTKDKAFSVNDESNMCLVGFIALLDPPKESSEKAIKGLQKHGVNVKVLTGDNDLVTRYICEQVGIDVSNIILGNEIEQMSQEQLEKNVMKYNIFAKLSPEQKSRIVLAIKANKHVVGYMGDGINDAAAMKAADIAISVDTAVDIAKESADIILLEKDLTILEKGVTEGRKTFCNIIKYIKMTVSSNFGNMLSLLIASIWLPFTPMFTTQILILNMVYDFSQYSVPWDRVDENYIRLPRKWDPKSIFKFMICMGPASTIFDVTSFLIMYYALGWNDGNHEFLFQTGWFIESLLTQIAVIYVLRTEKLPFIKSNPALIVNTSLLFILLIGLLLILVPGLNGLHFVQLTSENAKWIGYSVLIMLGYMATAQIVKTGYIKLTGEWL
ncbi:MAG: magnesium-translocating P-type ATPase [Mycoplasma sp.]